MFLIFDPEHRGHHGEFLENLIYGLLDSEDGYVMYASPLLQTRLEATKQRLGSKLQIKYFENEWTLQLLDIPSMLKRGKMETEMALKLVCQEQAFHLLFMQMNMNQLYLGLKRQSWPCSLSGIVLNHYTPLNRTNQFSGKVKAGLTAIRKLATYWWMLRSRKVVRVFILNDPEGEEYLNQRLKTGVFRSVPDPMPYYLENLKTPERRSTVKETVFLLCGSMAPRKGCLELLDALSLLPSSIHEVIQVRILGRFRTVRYRQNVERAVEELRRNRPNIKLELRTEFLSNAEFVNALNCCDYILAPYLEFYGSSGVLGQAARLGKPVLSCRDGLLGEIVRKQSLGVTFDPSNALEFAHVIQSAVEGEVHIDLDSAKKFISTQSAEKFCQEITGI